MLKGFNNGLAGGGNGEGDVEDADAVEMLLAGNIPVNNTQTQTWYK
jgi:hypothetical protein